MLTSNGKGFRSFAATVLVSLLAMQAAGRDTPGADAQSSVNSARLYPETGKTVAGRFLAYWDSHGGLAQQGLPISQEMQEVSDTDGKTYTVQYFERAVFELHPENVNPYDVLLSLLGTYAYNGKYGKGAAPGEKANTDNPTLFKQTGKSLGGRFRRYWEAHGGLAQQGYPISDEFLEQSDLDGKTRTVQYFERALFEYHPESAGTQFEVLLAQLGKFRYDKLHKSDPAATPVAPGSSVPPEVPAWLSRHAIPLRTVEPDGDRSDLLPLKQVVGDARIVMLGEATHGAHDFQTMKHRLVRFLVEEMGFTIFAIEDGWAEAQSVNDYVLYNQGTAEEAISKLPILFWRTQEMLDMLKWMRAYNEHRGSAPPIRFQGVDMQRPNAAMDIVVTYLQGLDPAAAERAHQRYECFVDFRRYLALPPEAREKCRADLQAVYDDLTANTEMYRANSSAERFAQAQFGALIVLQSEERRRSQDGGQESEKSLSVRDRAMADNLSRLLDEGGSDAKAIVWAHNAHVGAIEGEDSQYRSMGWLVKQKYGQSAQLIGLDFYNGSFNAFGVPAAQLQLQKIEASPPGSYGEYFHSARIPAFFLNLRGVESNGAGWLTGPRKIWSIGSVFDHANPLMTMPELSLTRTFDAVIHIDTINPTTMLP